MGQPVQTADGAKGVDVAGLVRVLLCQPREPHRHLAPLIPSVMRTILRGGEEEGRLLRRDDEETEGASSSRLGQLGLEPQ